MWRTIDLGPAQQPFSLYADPDAVAVAAGGQLRVFGPATGHQLWQT